MTALKLRPDAKVTGPKVDSRIGLIAVPAAGTDRHAKAMVCVHRLPCRHASRPDAHGAVTAELLAAWRSSGVRVASCRCVREPLDSGRMSLTDTLAALGYTHERTPEAERTGRHFVRRGGVEVYAGRAGEVWIWLRRTGQIA